MSADGRHRIRRLGRLALLVGCLAQPAPPLSAAAFDRAWLEPVVSVLPLWPGHERGGRGDIPPGAAPEGTAVALRAGGHLLTALHVVERAVEITVRLADGRELPARLVARDAPTDLALLRIEESLPPVTAAPAVALGQPVCAVANQFGLGLSVTCGVVSATARSGTGFNPVEDFIQTDAAVNPGASGGALLDSQGRFVGLLSAIFASGADANLGVNFAVSAALAYRVIDDLIEHGRVRRGNPGFTVADLPLGQRRRLTGVVVRAVAPDGPAAHAGLRVGDVIRSIDGRALRKPSDALAAIYLRRPGERLRLEVVRNGDTLTLHSALAP